MVMIFQSLRQVQDIMVEYWNKWPKKTSAWSNHIFTESAHSFAWTHNGICMDAPGNLHGRTREFAWTHNGICMTAQRNLLGHITFIFWGQKNYIYFLLFLLCCWGLTFMDLGHDQHQHPTVHSGEGPWLWMLPLVTCDRWHATHDTWHLTNYTLFWLVLLSAHVKRFSVSRMQDFLFPSLRFLAALSSFRSRVVGWLVFCQL